jgi:signal transduction histidine kinase
VIGLTVTSRDISKRKKAENTVDFLHTVLRHDLRNKIQVIRGYLSLINRSNISEKEKEYINIALNASIEGGALIDKIDTFKEMDQKVLEKMEKISLIPVIKDVINEYNAQSIKLGIKIGLKESAGNYTIWGGPLIREIFSNLIENSLTHSKGSLVEISIAEMNGYVQVRVEDNGVGVPDNLKNILFERGVKGETSKGSGLGLYFVKTIIEAYNGSINVEDSNIGGIKFNLVFKKS